MTSQGLWPLDELRPTKKLPGIMSAKLDVYLETLFQENVLHIFFDLDQIGQLLTFPYWVS